MHLEHCFYDEQFNRQRESNQNLYDSPIVFSKVGQCTISSASSNSDSQEELNLLDANEVDQTQDQQRIVNASLINSCKTSEKSHGQSGKYATKKNANNNSSERH